MHRITWQTKGAVSLCITLAHLLFVHGQKAFMIVEAYAKFSLTVSPAILPSHHTPASSMRASSQASAFVTDLYMGTSNQNASFGQAITGELASAQSNGIEYDFTELDRVTNGLASFGVFARTI